MQYDVLFFILIKKYWQNKKKDLLLVIFKPMDEIL